jgi:hypothetical protein
MKTSASGIGNGNHVSLKLVTVANGQAKVEVQNLRGREWLAYDTGPHVANKALGSGRRRRVLCPTTAARCKSDHPPRRTDASRAAPPGFDRSL